MNDSAQNIPNLEMHDSESKAVGHESAQNEKQLRFLIDGIKDYAIFLLDAEGFVTTWNSGAQRIKGYRSDEIIGHHFSQFYPAEAIASGHPDNELRLALDNGSYEEEGERIRKDGSTFSASVVITPLYDDNGVHFGFAKVTRDITERKRAEKGLLESEERFRRVFDEAATGIAITDTDGNFLDANKSFQAMLGFSKSELQSLSVLGVTHADDREENARLIGEILSHKRKSFILEKRYLRKDGGIVWGRVSASAQHDSSDKIIGFVGITEDITQERVAIEQNRVAQERFQILAKATNDAIWDWDFASGEVWWNDGFNTLFGHPLDREDSMVEFWISSIHEDDRENVIKTIQNIIDSDETYWSGEYRFQRADGSYANVFDRGFVIRDATGKGVRMVGGMTDQTERRNLEAQLLQSQRLDAIGQLAGGIAHDFNNLLTVINGYSELVLRRTDENDRNFKAMNGIHDAGKRAEALTRQLLAFSRRQVLEPKVLDLNQVIADLETMLRRLIGEDIVLSAEIGGDLHPVKVDPGQFEQVLINLSLNARDAMPRGGRLLIETKNVNLDDEYCQIFPDLVPGPYVMLAVTDTGTGINDAVKARIFEPFFTTKEVGKGTGLGLATVFGIVKQSEGHVAVYSEEGIGSSFKIYLPVVADGVGYDRSDQPNPILIPSGTESILLVEDEDSVRILATQSLEEYGYQVLATCDGDDALKKIAAGDFKIDILVSDVVMPHLGGRELAERIVEQYPTCKVLFLSGYTEDAIIRHGIIESEFSFLQKPFTPSALARKVREVLDAE